MRHGTRALFAAALVVIVPALAQAGPPLLCFPLSSDAPSLPWSTGNGWKTPKPDYDIARLSDDTLALLTPETPVLARMETIRRAVIYASADEQVARRLLDALRARAGRADDPKANPLALFDLGYAVETMRQAEHGLARFKASPAEDGYALVRAALARRGSDPAMEYAAALISVSPQTRSASDRHLRAAVGGAAPGSPLAKTIEAHRPLWGERLEAAQATASR